MELSAPEIKKFQEGTFRAQKKKKKTLQKNLLYFSKWNFLATSLKNTYISERNFLAILFSFRKEFIHLHFFMRISFFKINSLESLELSE